MGKKVKKPTAWDEYKAFVMGCKGCFTVTDIRIWLDEQGFKDIKWHTIRKWLGMCLKCGVVHIVPSQGVDRKYVAVLDFGCLASYRMAMICTKGKGEIPEFWLQRMRPLNGGVVNMAVTRSVERYYDLVLHSAKWHTTDTEHLEGHGGCVSSPTWGGEGSTPPVVTVSTAGAGDVPRVDGNGSTTRLHKDKGCESLVTEDKVAPKRGLWARFKAWLCDE